MTALGLVRAFPAGEPKRWSTLTSPSYAQRGPRFEVAWRGDDSVVFAAHPLSPRDGDQEIEAEGEKEGGAACHTPAAIAARKTGASKPVARAAPVGDSRPWRLRAT